MKTIIYLFLTLSTLISSCNTTSKTHQKEDRKQTKVVEIEYRFNGAGQQKDTLSIAIFSSDNRIKTIKNYLRGTLELEKSYAHDLYTTSVKYKWNNGIVPTNAIISEEYRYVGDTVHVTSYGGNHDTIRYLMLITNEDDNIKQLLGFSRTDEGNITLDQSYEYDNEGTIKRTYPKKEYYINTYRAGKLVKQIVKSHSEETLGFHEYTFDGDTIIDSYFGSTGFIQSKTYRSASIKYQYTYNMEPFIFKK